MDSYETYKEFTKIAKGPVDEEDFRLMLLAEADVLENEERGLSYSNATAKALENIKYWYESAYQYNINNILHFIATHRRQCTWAILLRLSHEPEFKTTVWLAGKLK